MKRSAGFLLMEQIIAAVQESGVYESAARAALEGAVALLSELDLLPKPTYDLRGAKCRVPSTGTEAEPSPLRPA